MKSLKQRWSLALRDWRWWMAMSATLLLLSWSLSAHAAKPSKEQEQFCAALSSYVWPIALNRSQGVPKAQAWSVLVQQNRQIAPSLEPSIRNLIDVFYSDEVQVAGAAELAAVVGEVNEECLQKVKQ